MLQLSKILKLFSGIIIRKKGISCFQYEMAAFLTGCLPFNSSKKNIGPVESKQRGGQAEEVGSDTQVWNFGRRDPRLTLGNL